MPADLDALDALLLKHGRDLSAATTDKARTLAWADNGAVALNSLSALLRRARIGDAAREVLELKALADHLDGLHRECPSDERMIAADKAWFEYDAARARYRALLETKDA